MNFVLHLHEQFKNKHLNSKFHSSLVDSNITRYVISNPEPDKIDKIIKNYITIHNEIYNQFQ